MIKVKNSSDFAAAMNLIGKKLKKDTGLINKELAMYAFVSVVNYTARDSGFAANNWDIVVNQLAPDQVLYKPKGGGKYPNATIDQQEVNRIDYKSYMMIFNNTSYMPPLEYGAPPNMEAQPMVKPTEMKLYKQAEKAANELSNKNYNL